MHTAGRMLIVMAVLGLVSPALADWDPGDPHKMHRAQLPDLEVGLDVLDGLMMPSGTTPRYAKFLADDFRCSQTGPITDLHIWGSWLGDNHPMIDIPKTFGVAIFSNVPADQSPTSYSRPGERLWSARLQPTERLYADADEAFFDPNLNEIIGDDTRALQYNFDIPADEAFVQNEGRIYWLGATLLGDFNGDRLVDSTDEAIWPDLAPFAYGWKTSKDHFQDDAVWTEIDPYGPHAPAQPEWNRLIDPRTGEGLDLSFVITPEPTTLSLMGLAGLMLIRRKRRA
ncbi:MAG: PEP-CTERM sorting domain-containing protein [Planctomycetota bacterium]